MKILIVFAILTAFVLLYVLHGRTWLKQQPWAQGFFDWVEPIEVWLWAKSESILFARFLMIMGLLPTILEQFQVFNTPQIMALIPEQFQGYLFLTFAIIGIIVEFNRRTTTKPLAMVAIADKDMPPEVRQAVDQAEQAKEEAVAVVKEAQAEGKV